MGKKELALIASMSSALLLGACGSGDPEPTGTAAGTATPSAAASPTSPPGANGELFTATFQSGEATLRRYPINADGSVGEAVTFLSGSGDDTEFPAVIDSVGGTVVTGTFVDYWATSLQVRNLDGTQIGSALTVDNWCGGEGLVANLCTLLDATRLARTTELGGEEVISDGSVIVSDLTSGDTVAEYGPFPGLTRMLGTSDPDSVLLATTTESASIDEPNAPGTLLTLNTSSGATSEVGDFPENWNALCAVGTDGALGQSLGTNPKLIGIGAATVGSVTIDDEDTVVGCSADGAYLYIQNISLPPTGEEDDDDPPNTGSLLERVSVADGTRTTVATLDPGEWVSPVSR